MLLPAQTRRQPEAKEKMATFIDIGLIITSIALIASVLLQSKGAGLGGLTGADSGSVFTARRGVERVLFRVTIALSVLFFVLALSALFLAR
jgi:preprotein translocase subunit SecG